MKISAFSLLRIICMVPLFAVVLVRAQTPGTGAIAGSVADPTGAVVIGARVSVVVESTQASREVTTSGDGSFRLALLQPGVYLVSVEAPGFQKRLARGVRVVGSETTTLELKLVIGSTGESVEVRSMAELAQTESSTL